MVKVIRERSRTEKDREAQRVVNGMIHEWATDLVDNMHKSGFYGINIVEKILRDPGFSTKGMRHRILWWPKNKRIAAMSRAMHQIEPLAQVCLVVAFGRVLSDDGTVFTKHELAEYSSVEVRRFNGIVSNAKTKLREILKS